MLGRPSFVRGYLRNLLQDFRCLLLGLGLFGFLHFVLQLHILGFNRFTDLIKIILAGDSRFDRALARRNRVKPSAQESPPCQVLRECILVRVHIEEICCRALINLRQHSSTQLFFDFLVSSLVVLGEEVVLEGAIVIDIFVHVIFHHRHREMPFRGLVHTESQVFRLFDCRDFRGRLLIL